MVKVTSVWIQGKTIYHTEIQVDGATTDAKEVITLWLHTSTCRHNITKIITLMIGISKLEVWIIRKFGLSGWNEAGDRIIEFCQENAMFLANIFFHNLKTSLDGQQQC